MRKYRLLHSITIAALACLMQGATQFGAIAGPMQEDTECDAIVVVAPAAGGVVPAVAVEPDPAAATSGPAEPARRADREALEPGERTRLVSYLILQGLKNAGPFLGAR